MQTTLKTTVHVKSTIHVYSNGVSFIRIDPQLSYSRYGKTMNAADNELKQSLKSAEAVEEERNEMDCIRSLPPLNTTCTKS